MKGREAYRDLHPRLGILFGAILAIVAVAAAGVHSDLRVARHVARDDVVEDLGRGLLWQRTASRDLFTWADALRHCRALVLVGGRGAFRLPSVKELQTLVDDTVTDPSIDRAAFPGEPSEFFWSSTPCAHSHGSAWGVNFAIGFTNNFPVGGTFRVRCVQELTAP
jgi:hypothetical protein